jgi:type III pantothenate kinase
MQGMLLLDAGNSRLKWAFVQDGAWLQQGVIHTRDWEELRQVFAKLPPPNRILASNVAGLQAAQQIRSACAMWNCPLEFVAARSEQCGVRNNYAEPAQLGSDRWAALIAAWQQTRGACLAVNCGTATTVDALSNAGEFLGGLILPGVEMMLRSLAAGTAQLEAARGNWRDFPRNTADAVYSGAIQATVGAIRQQHELLGVAGAPCVLGGGAANDIQAHLHLPLLRMDDMVLRGLQIIGLEAER